MGSSSRSTASEGADGAEAPEAIEYTVQGPAWHIRLFAQHLRAGAALLAGWLYVPELTPVTCSGQTATTSLGLHFSDSLSRGPSAFRGLAIRAARR